MLCTIKYKNANNYAYRHWNCCNHICDDSPFLCSYILTNTIIHTTENDKGTHSCVQNNHWRKLRKKLCSKLFFMIHLRILLIHICLSFICQYPMHSFAITPFTSNRESLRTIKKSNFSQIGINVTIIQIGICCPMSRITPFDKKDCLSGHHKGILSWGLPLKVQHF